jgi:hypothetical protein
LRQSGNLRFVDGYHHAILAALRDDLKGNQLFILVNMDLGATQALEIDAVMAGDWLDLVSNHPVSLTAGSTLTLSAAGYRVLRRSS